MRGRQFVKKAVWYIGGKRRKLGKRKKKEQRRKGLPIGLKVSAAGPFLGENTKPISKKNFGGRRRKRKRWDKTCF